jgi:hydrogenase/urease accessory protein HupE
MQGFYWGLLHPFTSGPQVLTLVALSLFIQQRLPTGENVFTGFWIGCITGVVAAMLSAARFDPAMPMTIFAIFAGMLVAASAKLPLVLLWSAGGMAGFLSGYVSWPDPGPVRDMLFSASGAVVGSLLTVIVVAGGTEVIREKTGWAWLAIAVRVAGSWVTAISVLLGALLLRNMI